MHIATHTPQSASRPKTTHQRRELEWRLTPQPAQVAAGRPRSQACPLQTTPCSGAVAPHLRRTHSTQVSAWTSIITLRTSRCAHSKHSHCEPAACHAAAGSCRIWFAHVLAPCTMCRDARSRDTLSLQSQCILCVLQHVLIIVASPERSYEAELCRLALCGRGS